MTLKALNLILLNILFGTLAVCAQDKAPVKFGKVAPEDFEIKSPLNDGNANAIVIADIGSSEFEGNSKGRFNIIFKRTKRIKILNKNGFDAANVSIHLYSNGTAEERLDKLKATTYNLEGGKVVETKLEEKGVFKNPLTKNWVEKKFTLPAVKEGSIIEYSYTVYTDFLTHLRDWEFQGEYPCLWSEYEVAIPFFFNYVFLWQGYASPKNIKSSAFKNWNVSDQSEVNFRTETFTLSGDVTYNKWIMRDVVPLKEENYTSTLQNHISRIEFQLSEIRYPNMPVHPVMSTWDKINEDLMKDENFGVDLTRNNNWMDDDLKAITGKAGPDPLARARSIYAYVRDNYTCTRNAGFYLTSTLKNVMKVKNGNVADINLLLCAMLKHEDIVANPVILSTRNHGYTHQFYPLMDRFNYVICEVIIDGASYYLDASHPEMGFGKLSSQCYNGHARSMGTACRPIYLEADSLVERKVTSVFIINNGKNGMEGSFSSTDGYMESCKVREKLKDKGKDAFFKAITSSTDENMDIMEQDVDSVKRVDDPVTVHYSFKTKIEGDIVYFNPLMKEGMKENLFKAAERKYPVEMPFAFDETYVLNMEIPVGYDVEEIPKSSKIAFNDSEGYFEYLIQKDAERVQLRTRIILRKTSFMPEEYPSLREFFGQIVKKHSESIVLKKKKA